MKKGAFLYVLAFLLMFSLSSATVPDADQDGVPDSDDNCPNSDTNLVDQFGCSCAQKSCPSDNNPCTDDCSVVSGIPICGFTDNIASCPNGYCSGGQCYPPNPNFQYMGYYWAYGTGAYGVPETDEEDFMEETAPFTNFVFIYPDDINTAKDATALDAVRRAQSLGVEVLLSVQNCFFGAYDADVEWDLNPNWQSAWNTCRQTYQIDQMVQEGNIWAFYVFDEPYLNGLTKSEIETAIKAIHDTYPGSTTFIIFGPYLEDTIMKYGVPAGLDIISFDYYGLETKEAYDSIYLPYVNWLKENTALPIILTTEAINYYFTPTPEQQSWYVNTAITDPRVIGLIHFSYLPGYDTPPLTYSGYTCPDVGSTSGNTCWVGARAFPDVINYHKQVFNTYIGKVSGTGTIQGYKVPSTDSTVSGQTVYLDNGIPTTANPYSFTNVPAGAHTVSVTALSGWSVGYTLCINSIDCHGNTPTSGSLVTVNVPSGGFADLWWHYTKPSVVLPVGYTAVYKSEAAKQIWVATRINPSTIILLAWADPLNSTNTIWRTSNYQTIIASETDSEIYINGVMYDTGVPADTYGASKEGSVWLTEDKLYLAWEGQAKVEHATRVGYATLPARYTKEWCGQNTICAKSSELYDEWDGWPGFYVPLKEQDTDETVLMGIGPWADPATGKGGFGTVQGYIYNHGTYTDFHGYDPTQCRTWVRTLGLCNSTGGLHHAEADHNLKAILTGTSAQWWSDSNNDHIAQCSEFGASGSNLPSTIYPHGMSVLVTDGSIPTRSEQSWAASTEGACSEGTAPSLSSVSPTTVTPGQTNVLTFTGSNFQSGAVMVYSGAAGGGEIALEYISLNELRMNTYVDAAFPTGAYTVKIKNPDAQISNGLQVTVVATPNPPPNLIVTPDYVVPGVQFTAEINNAQPNSKINLYLQDAASMQMYINGDELGYTNNEGRWSQSFDTTGWPGGSYKAWVSIAGLNSNVVYFSVVVSSKIPQLSVFPNYFEAGEEFVVDIKQAEPNSLIQVWLKGSNGELYINGEKLGDTNQNGEYSQSFDTTTWPVGSYTAWVVVSGAKSNDVYFVVEVPAVTPNLRVEPSTFTAGTRFYVNVDNAPANSAINVYLQNAANYATYIDGSKLGDTNQYGYWSDSFDTTGWPVGNYKAWVVVSGANSNDVYFTVQT